MLCKWKKFFFAFEGTQGPFYVKPNIIQYIHDSYKQPSIVKIPEDNIAVIIDSPRLGNSKRPNSLICQVAQMDDNS